MTDFQLIKTTYPYYWIKTVPNAVGTIFYIHGFADQPKMFWQKFIPTKNFNVIAVELPGHFETPVKTLKDLNPIKYGALCVELIKTLKLEHIIVMGHSMGGEIAIHVAAHLPQVVDKLVLISPANSHCATFSSYWQLLTNFTPQNTAQLQKFYQNLMHPDNAQSYARMLGPDAIANFKLRKRSYQIIKRHTGSIKNLIHMTKNEKHIVCPTLLILGTHDGTISYKNTSKYFDKVVANIKIATFEKSGHFAFLEQTQDFNKEVNDFLNH